MVVAENDPLKSLLNSIQVAFSALESNFHNLAKNIEHCFNGVVKNDALNFDDLRKWKVPIKICVGMDGEKCRSNDENRAKLWHGVDKVKVNLSRKHLQEGSGGGNAVNGKGNYCLDDSSERVGVVEWTVGGVKLKKLNGEEGKDLPFDHLMRFLFVRLSHFPMFDVFVRYHESKISKGKRVCRNGFSANLRFARVGGVPSVKDVEEESSSDSVGQNQEGSGSSSPHKLGNELLRNQVFKFVSLTELVELLPQIRRSSKEDHPDKRELLSVQDFFRYTEDEGKRFFKELDRDGDGQVTLEDLEVAMASKNLPRRYAKEFLQRTRSRFFSKSFGWREFLSVMEQKEPTFLQAYTSLRLSKSRTPRRDEILASLENAGLSANEDNATAMMQFLNADDKESKSYGHFRNFLVLLPTNHLLEKPRRHSSRVEIQTDSVLKTAFAGGISCSFSTFLMHPIDTVKTQVQASSTLSFTEIMSKLPQLGLRGLYMGSIPAIVGQFASHGLRTGICEVTKIVLINVSPTLPEIQVESVGSFLGTFLGTTMRIPCEVLKQRLQANQFNHVGEAMVGIWQQDGINGFFRGTAMTLCRELPFYVAGSSLYAQSKKGVQKVLGRELEPWETIVVGAISGGLTAVIRRNQDEDDDGSSRTTRNNVSSCACHLATRRPPRIVPRGSPTLLLGGSTGSHQLCWLRAHTKGHGLNVFVFRHR